MSVSNDDGRPTSGGDAEAGAGAGEGSGRGAHPDDALPLLTRDQAERFRRLVTDTMGRLGQEVVVHGDVVDRDDGHRFGLGNLSAVAATQDEGLWPETVERHCRTVVELADRPDPGLVALDENLLARLIEVDSLGPDGVRSFSYASEFAPGILRVLCVDDPESVRLLPDESVKHLTPLGPALDLGIRNLSRMLEQDEVDLDRFEDPVGEGKAHFDIVSGQSVYIASYPLCMPQVMAKWAPDVDVSRGVIFAVPFRNVLAFKVVGDAASILETLQLMAPFAIAAYQRNAGPLSPNVMLWEPSGAVTQLTWFDGSAIHVVPGPLERYLRDPG